MLSCAEFTVLCACMLTKHNKHKQTDKAAAVLSTPCYSSFAQLSYPEQKRTGRPHLNKTAKPITGKNSHDKPDYRLHAKPRDQHHVGIAHRIEVRGFEGGVPGKAG